MKERTGLSLFTMFNITFNYTIKITDSHKKLDMFSLPLPALHVSFRNKISLFPISIKYNQKLTNSPCSSSRVTHVCTFGQQSGSGHRHRNLAGSIHSGRPPCVPGISNIAPLCGHIFPKRWSPRCHYSRISHRAVLPQIFPVGHHSNRLHTSDSGSLQGEERWNRCAGIRWMTGLEQC